MHQSARSCISKVASGGGSLKAIAIWSTLASVAFIVFSSYVADSTADKIALMGLAYGSLSVPASLFFIMVMGGPRNGISKKSER